MVRDDDDDEAVANDALDGNDDVDPATGAAVPDEGDDDKAEEATAATANANDKADGNDEVEVVVAGTEPLWLSCDVEEAGAASSADNEATDEGDVDGENEYEIEDDDDGVETAMLVDDGISANVAAVAADAFDEMYFNNLTIAECSSLS